MINWQIKKLLFGGSIYDYGYDFVLWALLHIFPINILEMIKLLLVIEDGQ
jgi:hypothetical protein